MSKDKDKDKLLGDLTADALRKMRLRKFLMPNDER